MVNLSNQTHRRDCESLYTLQKQTDVSDIPGAGQCKAHPCQLGWNSLVRQVLYH